MKHDLDSFSNQPACLDVSPTRLDSMSPSELVDAMEQAIDAMAEETYNPAIIDAYLDALDRKAPIADDLNSQTSYADFVKGLQLLTAIEEPQQHSKYSKRPRRIFRSGLVVALIVACLLGSMALAQASGINVIGAIAH